MCRHPLGGIQYRGAGVLVGASAGMDSTRWITHLDDRRHFFLEDEKRDDEEQRDDAVPHKRACRCLLDADEIARPLLPRQTVQEVHVIEADAPYGTKRNKYL